MLQLILHLIGDYITQTSWMANNKTKDTLVGHVAAFLHAVVYSVPFAFIGSFLAFMVILTSHYLIDKFRLINYVKKFSNDTPAFISFWLIIIADNTIHLLINYLSLRYL